MLKCVFTKNTTVVYLIGIGLQTSTFDFSATSDMRVLAQGGARGQNLEHLRFFLLFFSCMEFSYLNNRYYLGLTLSVTFNVSV